MKKTIKIIIMACFLCQSPTLLNAEYKEQESQLVDDSTGWMLFGGIALAGFAIWAVSHIKSYFSGNLFAKTKPNIVPNKAKKSPKKIPSQSDETKFVHELPKKSKGFGNEAGEFLEESPQDGQIFDQNGRVVIDINIFTKTKPDPEELYIPKKMMEKRLSDLIKIQEWD